MLSRLDEYCPFFSLATLVRRHWAELRGAASWPEPFRRIWATSRAAPKEDVIALALARVLTPLLRSGELEAYCAAADGMLYAMPARFWNDTVWIATADGTLPGSVALAELQADPRPISGPDLVPLLARADLARVLGVELDLSTGAGGRPGGERGPARGKVSETVAWARAQLAAGAEPDVVRREFLERERARDPTASKKALWRRWDRARANSIS